MPLLTVGHGPEGRELLGARLAAAAVDRNVDVRRFPGSRTDPDVRREALADWLPAAGIAHRWEEPVVAGRPPVTARLSRAGCAGSGR